MKSLIESGLLRTIDDSVEFRHLILQEFFAGRGISCEKLLETLIFDDWWRRAVVFYFGERPSNAEALGRIRTVIDSRGPEERFIAAATLGLALQACYLVPVTDKISGLTQVIETLASIKDDIIKKVPGISKFPLTGFITYYLTARDSVALSALQDAADTMLATWDSSSATEQEKEDRKFWVIVGLLEANLVTDPERMLRGFNPKDLRLLLAIHLGCFLIQHVRISSNIQKKSAQRICGQLNDRIMDLRRNVLQEFKTHLLEMRRGEITGIPEDEISTDSK